MSYSPELEAPIEGSPLFNDDEVEEVYEEVEDFNDKEEEWMDSIVENQQSWEPLKDIDTEKSVYVEFKYKPSEGTEKEIFLCLEKYNFEHTTPMEVFDGVYYQTVLLEKGKSHKFYFSIGGDKFVEDAFPKTEDNEHNLLQIDDEGKQTLFTDSPVLLPNHETFKGRREFSDEEKSAILNPSNATNIEKSITTDSLRIGGKSLDDCTISFSKLNHITIESSSGLFCDELGNFKRDNVSFIVDLPFLAPIDSITLNFGFTKVVSSIANQVKDLYSITIEYHTLDNQWVTAIDKKPINDLFIPNSSEISLDTFIRAHKLRVTLSIEKDALSKDSVDYSYRTFKNTSVPFDKKGVLYWIGTSFGSKPYENPAKTGQVALQSSSQVGDDIINHEPTSVDGTLVIYGEPSSWFLIDLGESFSLSCSAYSIRHGMQYADMMIADWVFEGSNDKKNWVELHSQYLTPFDDQNLSRTFKTKVSPSFFRYFRVFMKGPNGYGPNAPPNGSNHMYIAGFELYGELLVKESNIKTDLKSVTLSVRSSLFSTSTNKIKSFKYKEDMDKNGILYDIATSGKTHPYMNPGKSGKVKLVVSSMPWNANDRFLVLELGNPSYSLLGPDKPPPTWFYVDLGPNNKTKATHYTLRHGSNYNEYFIQNFELQASNDLEEWVSLHAEKESPFTYAYQTTTFPIEKCEDYYRYYKLIQHGNSLTSPNQPGSPGMCICGFELYGDVLCEPLQEKGIYSPEESRIIRKLLSDNEQYFLDALKCIREDKDIKETLNFLKLITYRSNFNPTSLMKRGDLEVLINKYIIEASSTAVSNCASEILTYLLSIGKNNKEFNELFSEVLLEAIPTVHKRVLHPSCLENFISLLFFIRNTCEDSIYQILLKTVISVGQEIKSHVDKHYSKLFQKTSFYEFVLEQYLFSADEQFKKSSVNSSDEPESQSTDKYEEQLSVAIENFENQKRSLLDIVETGRKKELVTLMKSLLDSQTVIYNTQNSLVNAGKDVSILKNRFEGFQIDRNVNVCIKYFNILNLSKSSQNLSSTILDDIFNLFCINNSDKLKSKANEFISSNLSLNPDFPIHSFEVYLSDNTNKKYDTQHIFEQLSGIVNSPQNNYLTDHVSKLFKLLKRTKFDNIFLATNILNLLDNLVQRDYLEPHLNSVCKGCNASPITGVRWRNLNVVDYDLCSYCEAKKEHDPKHIFVKISKPLPLAPTLDDGSQSVNEPLVPKILYNDEFDSSDKVHNRPCDYCSVLVEGDAYLCTQCDYFFLCGPCHETNEHFPGHLFAKISVPLPDEFFSNPKPLVPIVLHKGFYPQTKKQDLKKESKEEVNLFSSSKVVIPKKIEVSEDSAITDENLRILLDLLYLSLSKNEYPDIYFLSFKVLNKMCRRIDLEVFKKAFIGNVKFKELIRLLIDSSNAFKSTSLVFFQSIFSEVSVTKFRSIGSDKSPAEVRDLFRDILKSILVTLKDIEKFKYIIKLIVSVSKPQDVSMRVVTESKNDWKTSSAPIKKISKMYYPTESVRNFAFQYAKNNFNFKTDLDSWNDILLLLTTSDPSLTANSSDFSWLIEKIMTGGTTVRSMLEGSLKSLINIFKKENEIRKKIISLVATHFFKNAQSIEEEDILIASMVKIFEDDIPNIDVEIDVVGQLIYGACKILPSPESFGSNTYSQYSYYSQKVLLVFTTTLLKSERYSSKSSELSKTDGVKEAFSTIISWLESYHDLSYNSKGSQGAKSVATIILNELIWLMEFMLQDDVESRHLFSMFAQASKGLLEMKSVFTLFLKLMEKENFVKYFIFDMNGHEFFLNTIREYVSEVNESSSEKFMTDGQLPDNLPEYEGLTSFSSICTGKDMPPYSNFNSMLTQSKPGEKRFSYQHNFTDYSLSTGDYALFGSSIKIESKHMFLLKGFLFNFSCTYSSAPSIPYSVVVEAGIDENTLTPVGFHVFENKSEKSVENTIKVMLDGAHLAKYISLTFYRRPLMEYLYISSLQILGESNLLTEKEVEVKAKEISPAYASNVVKLISNSFRFESVRSFYNSLPSVSDFMVYLLNMSEGDDKALIEGILQHIVAHSLELKKKLFTILMDKEFPLSSSKFVGKICSFPDNERESRLESLKQKIFQSLSVADDIPQQLPSLIGTLVEALLSIQARNEVVNFSLADGEINTVVNIILRGRETDFTSKPLLTKLLMTMSKSNINYLKKSIEFINYSTEQPIHDQLNKVELLSILSTISDEGFQCVSKLPFLVDTQKFLASASSQSEEKLLPILSILNDSCIHKEARSYISSHLLDTIFKLALDKSLSSSVRLKVFSLIKSSCTLNPEGQNKTSKFIIDATQSFNTKEDDTIRVLGDLLYQHDEVNVCLYPLESGEKEILIVNHFSKHGDQIKMRMEERSSPDLKKDNFDVVEIDNGDQNSSWKTAYMLPAIPSTGVTSFDVEILRVGDMNMGIGISEIMDVNNMYYMLGNSMSIQSVGFYGYDQSYVYDGGSSMNYGKPFREGDIVTVKVDMIQKTLEYFINGESLGVASTSLSDEVVYYPAVSLYRDESCRFFNFKSTALTTNLTTATTSSYHRNESLTSIKADASLHQVIEIIKSVVGNPIEGYDIEFYNVKTNEKLPLDKKLKELLPVTGESIVDISFKVIAKDAVEEKKDKKDTKVKIYEVKNVFQYFIQNNGLQAFVGKLVELLDERKNQLNTEKNEQVTVSEWKFWSKCLSQTLNIDGMQKFIQSNSSIVLCICALINKLQNSSDLAPKSPLLDVNAMDEHPNNILLDSIIQAFKESESSQDEAFKLREELLNSDILLTSLIHLSELTDILPKETEEENEFTTFTIETKKEKEAKAKKKKEASSSVNYWAKGTGFGTNADQSTGFSLNEYIKKNMETARRVAKILDLVSFFIDPYKNDEPVMDKIFSLITKSCLQQVLESYLRNDSLLEMARTIELYRSIFKLCRKASACDKLYPMLSGENQSYSIYSLLEQLQRIAVLIDKLPSLKKEGTTEPTETEKLEEEQANEEDEKEIAQDIKNTFIIVKETVDKKKKEVIKKEETTSNDSEKDNEMKFFEEYVQALADHQFGEINMKDKSDSYVHHYKKKIEEGTSSSSAKMKRIVQELSVLSTSLPIHPESSAFIRVDEERIDVMKVLITGPEGTPYESGCFLFDVFLDSNYPDKPPNFNLMTTGKGSVRFNPNLYNCGKVCLSLLGTWRGGPNEGWNRETSTILQVIISIQSLIFVKEPYFNEPGYESSMNTDYGQKASREYNDNIKNATLKWAFLDMIKNPPSGFEEIIKLHFTLKKDKIKNQFKRWIEESKDATPSQQSEMKKTVESILTAIKDLEKN